MLWVKCFSRFTQDGSVCGVNREQLNQADSFSDSQVILDGHQNAIPVIDVQIGDNLQHLLALLDR